MRQISPGRAEQIIEFVASGRIGMGNPEVTGFVSDAYGGIEGLAVGAHPVIAAIPWFRKAIGIGA